VSAFLFLLIFVPASAGAIELEIAVGQSEYCCRADGVWWQSEFGFNGNMRPTSWEIGARHRIGNWGIHAAYVDLGTVSANNIASMRDDDFGKHDPTKPCDAATQKNCLGQFSAKQNVRGVLAGASYGIGLPYGARLEAELGQYFYRARWDITIQCPDCGNYSLYSFGFSHSFRYVSETRRTPYVSGRVSYKNVFLMYRRFSYINGGGTSEEQYAIGLTGGPVNQFMVGISL
jgi:hypothetical protein